MQVVPWGNFKIHAKPCNHSKMQWLPWGIQNPCNRNRKIQWVPLRHENTAMIQFSWCPEAFKDFAGWGIQLVPRGIQKTTLHSIVGMRWCHMFSLKPLKWKYVVYCMYIYICVCVCVCVCVHICIYMYILYIHTVTYIQNPIAFHAIHASIFVQVQGKEFPIEWRKPPQSPAEWPSHGLPEVQSID